MQFLGRGEVASRLYPLQCALGESEIIMKVHDVDVGVENRHTTVVPSVANEHTVVEILLVARQPFDDVVDDF